MAPLAARRDTGASLAGYPNLSIWPPANFWRKQMTEEQMREIARGNVERHLGDIAAEHPDEELPADSIYQEAYTLAFVALVEAGVEHETARDIAGEVARSYAQPRKPSGGK
jgi:hypothetical protein